MDLKCRFDRRITSRRRVVKKREDVTRFKLRLFRNRELFRNALKANPKGYNHCAAPLCYHLEPNHINDDNVMMMMIHHMFATLCLCKAREDYFVPAPPVEKRSKGAFWPKSRLLSIVQLWPGVKFPMMVIFKEDKIACCIKEFEGGKEVSHHLWTGERKKFPPPVDNGQFRFVTNYLESGKHLCYWELITHSHTWNCANFAETNHNNNNSEKNVKSWNFVFVHYTDRGPKHVLVWTKQKKYFEWKTSTSVTLAGWLRSAWAPVQTRIRLIEGEKDATGDICNYV